MRAEVNAKRRRMDGALSALTHLACPKCGAQYDADAVQHLCGCGGPLLAQRESSMWRYAELLPLRDARNRVSLQERVTPLIPLKQPGLYLKDEGALPTGSFKARGAAVGVSRAKELGIKAFAMPTNGNAGGAWAAYAARAGMEAWIFMPQSAPRINRLECVLTGARVALVDGLISDAGRLAAEAIAQHDLYDAATLKEPYRIEGKKTMGFEIAEQFGWNVPDVILYPTGGGVGLIGIHKALRELQRIGLIGMKMPRFVAVQAEGCAPIVEAFRKGKTQSEFWPDARTVAFGITVPKALGDFLVLEALYETNGTAIAVSDDALLAAQRRTAAQEGLLICPEGAATIAAADHLRAQGWIAAHERVLAINTGTGLKYPDVPYPQPPLVAR